MISEAIRLWLKQTLETDELTITTLSGGANNRGYQVASHQGSWFLKSFSPHHTQSTNKLTNEFSFSQHLWNNGVKSIPEPIASCKQNYVSLFKFTQGDSIECSSPKLVSDALQFIERINDIPLDNKSLNVASESPSSLIGFHTIIERRLARFKATENSKCLKELLEKIQNRADKVRCLLPENAGVKLERNILSPSDFGFHNAMKTKQGLVFFDFEYAGMDTSWKLLCDFFSQPAVPIEMNSLKLFFDSQLFQHIPIQRNIFLTTLELTHLKWCLIMLNEFIDDIQTRRKFSWNKSCITYDELEEVKSKQLAKSQKYFESIAARIESASTFCDLSAVK
ncbi:aminoglycoside phosphotransferase family protein [Pseudoalteromonas luteoviolacea]|uniref:aminoglycoside phosphotransferase family protein n=1 Tax=Pseudoalteromonas luteoviolacea TaxID=43657 RepID=UPI001F3862EA|nr:aminoglycoside phosphotransferase family protein [Pseudoalteromonas luteoviolacea]MCF6440356.1 aminoglycoside phosphotransferase family protein [Pseudoalteromonas luteoviolacea]